MSELWNHYEQVLGAAEQLSSEEMEELAGELLEMAAERRKGAPGKPQSQYGIWMDLPRVSAEEIADARKDMWSSVGVGDLRKSNDG